MPVFDFLFGQLVETKFGLTGAIALLLISIGKKTNSSACAGAGGVVLALLVLASTV